MIIKKTIILSVVVLLLIAVAGCKKNPVQTPQNSEQGISTEYGEIIDPGELEKFWQEYFYDSIATIGNTHEFNSAGDYTCFAVTCNSRNTYAGQVTSGQLKGTWTLVF